MRCSRLICPLLLGVSLLISPPLHSQSTETLLTPRTFVEVSKRVLPGVVSIDVRLPMSQRVQEDFDVQTPEELQRWLDENGGMLDPDLFGGDLREFFRRYNARDFGYFGSGSGVVIRQSGDWAYVLTNRHVVDEDERTEYTITLDTTFSADEEAPRVEPANVELVGMDELTDLAVLRFRVPEGTTFPEIEFADSDKAEVGEWVLALGNPLELNNSVSQGIISAKNRQLGTMGPNRIENLLQTTAVINPGNSGGPLVNLDGAIVGINNAIKTDTGRWSGIGFAIPSNQARFVAEELIGKGKVSRGFLGISMTNVTDPSSSVYDMKLERGVSVERITPDTPAEEAGLRRGDVVVGVDGRDVRRSQQLLETIANRPAGETVKLRVVRYVDGQATELDVDVTLMERVV